MTTPKPTPEALALVVKFSESAITDSWRTELALMIDALVEQAREQERGVDLERGMAYFRVAKGDVARTVEAVPDKILVDVDAEGKILGLELLVLSFGQRGEGRASDVSAEAPDDSRTKAGR